MNFNALCCYDFESTGRFAESAQIVQIGAIMIDPRRLEIIEGTEFDILVKPLYSDSAKAMGLEELSDGAIKIHGKTHELLAEKGVSFESAMANFVEYVNSHNPAKTKWKAPIAAGYNINNYDSVILKRDLARCGLDNPFHPIYAVDGLQFMFGLFENDKNVTSLSADNLIRRHMGWKDKGASHDALSDVIMTAELLCKTLRLMRKVASKTVFENCFGE